MLTGKQRSYLKSLAMKLDTAVFIGKAGLTENVLTEMDNYLEAHELVKVKLQEGAELDPKDTANEAAAKLGADFVQAIGRKFVLYRPAEEKVIVLPR
ncbi:MAG: YhbY family RNA-binding protein [Firmicutes bacterium]|jgi:RNA-binding protein|nr:YhbY family RNA-binding protein [Bacillota bacterium]